MLAVTEPHRFQTRFLFSALPCVGFHSVHVLNAATSMFVLLVWALATLFPLLFVCAATISIIAHPDTISTHSSDEPCQFFAVI